MGQLRTLGTTAWVIPMDNIRQTRDGVPSAVFNMKAYGLVNRLLWAGIPLMWSIRPDKAKALDPSTGEPIDEPDFQAVVAQVKPGAGPTELVDFYGGPFVIPIKFTKQAEPIIDDFNNHNADAMVNVFEVKKTTSVWVRYDLTHKPRVAVLNPNSALDPFERILDRTGGFDPGVHYDVINPTQAHSLPPNGCYTAIVAPHTEHGQVTQAMRTAVSEFVHNGGNFLAQCLAVHAYENDTQTSAQTIGGITVANEDSPVYYENPALAFSQFQGALNGAETGTLQDWDVPGGIPADFINNAHVHVRSLKPPYGLVATASKFNIGQIGSLTFYLGGHNYAGDDDQRRINGLRMLLNAIMIPAKPQGCQPAHSPDTTSR